jgi:two-component sensor histidine kinase
VSGRVSVRWDLQDDDILILAWEEIGGPPVQKPASRGFGTRSVIASIESQLGGQALFDWRPEGLLCRLLVPLSSQAADASDRKTQLSSNTSFQMSAGSAAR